MVTLAWLAPLPAQAHLNSLPIPTSEVFLGVPRIFTLFSSTTGLCWASAACVGHPVSFYILAFSGFAAASLGEGRLTPAAISQLPSSSEPWACSDSLAFSSVLLTEQEPGYSPCTNEENTPFSRGIKPITEARLGTGPHFLVFQLKLHIPELTASSRSFPWFKSLLHIDA